MSEPVDAVVVDDPQAAAAPPVGAAVVPLHPHGQSTALVAGATAAERIQVATEIAKESWRESDDHALRSMAQTRATGKAIAGVARWIITLAGYAGTPAEEMPADGVSDDVGEPTPPTLPEASPQLRHVCREAVAWALAGDQAAVEDTFARLSHQYDGKFPAAAGQAIVLLAGAIKRQHDAADAAAAAEDEARAAA